MRRGMFPKFDKISVGADPELFLMRGSDFVSCHDLFSGSKKEPFRVMKGAVQVDGTAFEFNIHPAKEVSEFLKNVETVVNTMQLFAKKVDPSLKIVVTPTAIYDRKYFDSLPEEAKALGCEPDYNAYTGKENTPPETEGCFRTGAGHIHVGWTEDENPFGTEHYYDCIQTVKQLDHALYIPSLLWDNDNRRRELYGKIGAFRPKTYGVEWRPLSNSWVSDPDIGAYIFDSTVYAMGFLADGVHLSDDNFFSSFIDKVQNGDTLDKKDCVKYHDYLVNEYEFPSLIETYL